MAQTGYDKYFKRLHGEKVETYDGDPEPGFYRLPQRTSRQEGSKITGWKAVAYFYDGLTKTIVGVIGDRDMTPNEITDLWTHVCAYPIPEQVYRDIEAGKPWPRDLIGEPKQASRTAYPSAPMSATIQGRTAHTVVVDDIPAADRVVTASDNAPPVDDLTLDQQHKQAIENAVKAPVSPITSAEEDAAAMGRKNRIAELRLAAEKAGKAIYEPMFRVYTAEQKKWSPLGALCTAKEREITTAVLLFRESERKRLLKIQQDADEAQRVIDEANVRAADRAIMRGEPEPAPTVVHAPVFDEVRPTPVMPTYGTRVIKEELKKFAEIPTPEAWAQVREHFKDNAELRMLLMKLSQAEVNAGRTVPGVQIREGLV